MKEDKDYRENVEKRIKEWGAKLERMNKEIDIERKKSNKLTKENNNLK